MADKVIIDVEARFTDRMTDPATSAADKVQKEINAVANKKVAPIFDGNNSRLLQKLRQSEERAGRFAGKTYRALLALENSKALSALNGVSSKMERLTGKGWQMTLHMKDFALAPLTKTRDMLFNIKTLMGAIIAGYGAKRILLNPVSLADTYSGAKIGFSTLLGEARGQKMMNDLDAFAKATPFKTAEVIANSQRMLAMGWQADKIIEDMTTIGDAAAATGKGDEGLNRIVLALSQIRSKGKLSTEELNQLAEAGISAKRYLAEGLGYGTGDMGLMAMTKDLERGAIGAETAIAAITEGMKEYRGMMDRTANETAKGLGSQIADTFEINIFRRWGQGLQDGAKRGLGAVVTLLDSADKGLERLGNTLYDIGAAFSNWSATKLERFVDRVTALAASEDFQRATLGGKIKILWDGAVADPIKEWWEGGGKTKTALTAGKVGNTIGRTITGGLLAIFGATDILKEDFGADAGMNVGQSFLNGFLEGFDGKAIGNAFVDAIGNIWGALPWWGKLLLGGYGFSKASNLFSGIMGGLSRGGAALGGLGKTLLGSTGNAMVQGTGLLNLLANMGYGAAAGPGLSGSAAALIGAKMLSRAVPFLAGGITGASGLYDLYQGVRDNDAVNKKAGAWKVGGAAGGAALGAAISTATGFAGLGTAIGALIGSGIGWWQSNRIKKAAIEQQMAVNGLTKAEAELKVKMDALSKEDLAKHFGDIALSAAELEQVIHGIMGENLFTAANGAAEAISAMEDAFTAFAGKDSGLKKSLWLAAMKKDVKLTAAEMANLTANVSEFDTAAQGYIKDAQYAAAGAVSFIMENSEKLDSLLASTNSYYEGQGKTLMGLTAELRTELEAALSDNVISLDEEKSLQKIRGQISDILRKIQEDEYEANMNIISAKYGGNLTPETFGELMKGAADAGKNLADSYWEAFGRASVGKSQEEIELLRKGVLENLSAVWGKTAGFGLETMQGQYKDELGILGLNAPDLYAGHSRTEILGAASRLTPDTRASMGKMLEHMEPTTKEVRDIVSSMKEAGIAVPKNLTSYLETVDLYGAMSQGQDALIKHLQGNALSVDMAYNVNASLNPIWSVPGLELTPEMLGIEPSYTFGTMVEIAPTIVSRTVGIANSMASFTGIEIPGFATGGMVQGSEKIIRVAEEGTPEMIIPLGIKHRERGKQLWQQAGEMLGIPGFAQGGLITGQDDGIRFGGTVDAPAISGGMTQVEVGGITVEINIEAQGDGESIVQTIKDKGEEIAQVVAERMASAFDGQFANTPLRGGAV